MKLQFKILFIAIIALVVTGLFIFPKDSANQEPAISTVESIAPATVALPRLIELGSVGCKPCKLMAPIIEELKNEYEGKLSVEFYDVRENPEHGRKYSIKLIPTQIFLDAEGNEFFRHEGFFLKEDITAVLDSMGVTN